MGEQAKIYIAESFIGCVFFLLLTIICKNMEWLCIGMPIYMSINGFYRLGKPKGK